MVDYIPNKGDIVWLDFDPQKGKEIMKTRPALVVSPYQYNQKTNLAIFMPITSQIKNYPFEVEVMLQEVKGVILCDQVRSLDWFARKARKISKVDDEILNIALSRFKLIIDS